MGGLICSGQDFGGHRDSHTRFYALPNFAIVFTARAINLNNILNCLFFGGHATFIYLANLSIHNPRIFIVLKNALMFISTGDDS
jgi:NADH:ubiquinone oxidoreductase subunit H